MLNGQLVHIAEFYWEMKVLEQMVIINMRFGLIDRTQHGSN